MKPGMHSAQEGAASGGYQTQSKLMILEVSRYVSSARTASNVVLVTRESFSWLSLVAVMNRQRTSLHNFGVWLEPTCQQEVTGPCDLKTVARRVGTWLGQNCKEEKLICREESKPSKASKESQK